MTRERTSGQVLPLVALVIALGAFAVMGLGRMGARIIARAEAQTAADAAALAGVAAGEAAAREVAAANGAELVSLTVADGVTRAEVRRRGEAAQARARRVPDTAECGSATGRGTPDLGRFESGDGGQSTPQCSPSPTPSPP